MRDFLLKRGWSYFEANLFIDVIRNIGYLAALLLAFQLFFFCRYDVSGTEWRVMSAWTKKDFYCDFLHIGWEKVSYPGKYS